MIRHKSDPNRLHLRKWQNTPTYFIVYQQRRTGQVNAAPILTKNGFVQPAILLEAKFSEQMVERIKDLLNKVMKTNHDFRVHVPPRRDHPAIEKYLLKKQAKW